MDTGRFLELLSRFPGRRIGVVGDFLLDQYVLGTTSRVSREAPIVVVDYQETVNHPGGAANAAQNVTALGAAATAVGVLGGDREGDALSRLLAARGVDTGRLRARADGATSTKLRILAGEMNAQKQQVARVDRSQRVVLDAPEGRRLAASIDEVARTSDAVLLADYGLGVLTPETAEIAVHACRERGIPVVVDSRHRLSMFRGATAATPNEVEAMEALRLGSEADLVNEARLRAALDTTGIGGLVVTRGSQGMVVCGEGTFAAIGIVGSDAATDVTGAGDTVSAVVALSLAAGATLVEAARMATFAAAVVVMKRGTATVSPAEMRAVIASGEGA
jgi:rfaE bifunctional protein kinase chain/domain